MIWLQCKYDNEKEYQQLVDLAAALELFPGRVKVKDFYKVCQFKPAKTAKKTDNDEKKGE